MSWNLIDYYTDIVIKADAASVYEAVTDFSVYPKWNPFVLSIDGSAVLGEVVLIKVRLGKRVLSIKHEMVELEPNKGFRWADVDWFTRAACGRRVRKIIERDDGSILFRNDMPVHGPLAWFSHLVMGKDILDGMNAENRALKEYVESRAC